jgi:two-component system, NarL family, response regulator NreC
MRILIADDHNIVRKGLRLLLERELEFSIVGEASGGRVAIEAAGRLNPDVILMDIGMPNLNGIEATKRIGAVTPSIPVIILSVHSDEAYILRVLKAGARGYLLKDSAESDLISGVVSSRRVRRSSAQS